MGETLYPDDPPRPSNYSAPNPAIVTAESAQLVHQSLRGLRLQKIYHVVWIIVGVLVILAFLSAVGFAIFAGNDLANTTNFGPSDSPTPPCFIQGDPDCVQLTPGG